MTDDRQASSLEIRPLQIAAERYDAAILGGGLAGLTLAIQLKQQRPDTSIAVLEKREGPAPLAAFKVGESTVPSGAHYFADVVGMRDHLKTEQLKKCGLRFFPPEGDNGDITSRPEVGTPVDPPYDNFQIDRGLFENKLAARAKALGVDVLQGCRVQNVELGGDLHTVNFTQADSEESTRARWVVDATGRSSLMKRQLGLGTDCGHHIDSAWFRLGGGLDIEDWGREDAAWMDRMSQPGLRRLSTNHLLGEGYWVWLIPLSSGPISIGVCADPRFHPFEEINEFGRLLDWLRNHEPQLAASVERRVDDIEDFLRVEDFAFGVERTLSPDRWALVGEAGAFADPFYSPGSDFIAYGNLFAGDLIARDCDGEDIGERLDYYNDFYQRAFEHVVSRYRDTYEIFGNPLVCSALLAWDAYSGHNGLPFLCLQNKLTDFDLMRSVDADLDRLFRLNAAGHRLFREWHEREQEPLPPAMLGTFPVMLQSLAALEAHYPNDDAIREQVSGHVRNSEAMLVSFFHRAARTLPEPPSPDRAINPYAVGLDPEKWEADGLFESPGLTLDEASQVVVGVDAVFAPARPFTGQPSH
jgi:flavin-dependent dehydrogenase